MQSQKEIAKALRILTHEENYPIVVHCMHGKDRTGLLIMLIMLLCDIDPQVQQFLAFPCNVMQLFFRVLSSCWYETLIIR